MITGNFALKLEKGFNPPYNTGNDFIYRDDFAQGYDEYMQNSGQRDDDGNRMEKNLETNGRFHTDWLNMMYPRLKVAKNLLSETGAIFINMDEHEETNLTRLCDEIFGTKNKLGTIVWDKRNPKGSVGGVSYQHESILIYAKNKVVFSGTEFSQKKEHANEMLKKVQFLIRGNKGKVDEGVRNRYKEWLKDRKKELSGGESAYSEIDENGDIYQVVSMAAPDKPETRSHKPLIHPITGKPCPVPAKGWRFKDITMKKILDEGKVCFGEDESTQPRQKYLLKENITEAVSSVIYYGGNGDAMGLPFDNPKPVEIPYKMIYALCKPEISDIVLDFFSGSATTAHAVMKLNSEDDGKRKFIMVQIPEAIEKKSDAGKAGYKTICDIGKERIRRAGKAIMDECVGDGDNKVLPDVGFRVLRLDSSNMEDIYYTSEELQQSELGLFVDNVKPDRTAEDLLFQSMLELGAELSSRIERLDMDGKTVYEVADGHILACFEKNLTEEVLTAMAKRHPTYAVLRDSSYANDSVAANCEQIFRTYSEHTELKVL